MTLPLAPGAKRMVVYDAEVFPNWFCFVLSDGEKCKVYSSARGNIPDLVAKIGNNLVLAGFNNFSYDDVLFRAVCNNPKIAPETLFKLSQRIIVPGTEQESDANFKARYSKTPWAYSIDVFQLLNGKGSLKEHACRSAAEDVGESPYPFGEPLPPEGYESVERYCCLDALNTAKKLVELWPMVTLRTTLSEMFELGDRVYCLTEQGIAQATFLKLHRDRTGQYSGEVRAASGQHPDNLCRRWALSAIVSPKVHYSTPAFQSMLTRFASGHAVAEDCNGQKWGLSCPTLPADLAVDLAGHRFQLGVGGLHSLDGPGRWASDARKQIVDLDVTSYYPSIIIEDKLFPGHMGPGFVEDMRRLRDLRVAAKRAGDKKTADALKIVINATFGKLNDLYSPLRSVPNAMRVTINGQLYLLMLVEMLHAEGATILSANTDGVTILWDRDDIALCLPGVIDAWQKATGFELERTDYTAYARRDVNNYVAAGKGKKGLEVKVKGAFFLTEAQGYGLGVKPGPESGKGDGLIIKRAAVAYLANGTPIAETVENGKPHEFIFYQRCKNGGTLEFDRQPIGRLARWYASICGGVIRRQNPNRSYATIPHGHSATLAMRLDVGKDLDKQYYIDEAEKLVKETSPT